MAKADATTGTGGCTSLKVFATLRWRSRSVWYSHPYESAAATADDPEGHADEADETSATDDEQTPRENRTANRLTSPNSRIFGTWNFSEIKRRRTWNRCYPWDELDTDPLSAWTGTDRTAESDQETDVEESATGVNRVSGVFADLQQLG